MWVGLDDTDGPEGGCTTWLATEVVRRLGLELLGPPRLVRLAPMAPHKTRGNGAVALHVDGPASAAMRDRIVDVVEDHAEPGADPGVVVTDRRPPRSLYEAAVTRLLDVAAVEAPDGALTWGGRGRLGALAAVAWRPGDATWELLAYREPARWGTPREVDAASVRRAARACPSAWDCIDPATGDPVMVPNGPDPVLWGLRGDDAADVRRGLDVIAGEPVDRWWRWRTNQGTDDHLTRQPAADLRPGSCPVVAGEIASEPETRRGGHVFVDLEDGTGRCRLAAFEPTKTFRDVVRRLRPGDRVTACGGTRDGATVQLEKLRVDALADVERKLANPVCCAKAMASVGAGAGFRCTRCGHRVGDAAAERRRVDRGLREGWYEVPPGARRHLAKPVKRLSRGAGIGDRARVAKLGQRRTVQGRVP